MAITCRTWAHTQAAAGGLSDLILGRELHETYTSIHAGLFPLYISFPVTSQVSPRVVRESPLALRVHVVIS